jgi:hypothetical protein
MTRRRLLVGFGVLALLLLFLTVKLAPARDGDELVARNSDAPFGPFSGYAWIGSVTSEVVPFAVEVCGGGRV